MREDAISKKSTIFIFLGLGLLLLACVVGGAIAYFISKTDTISNTFRKGSLVIETTTDWSNNDYGIRANENIIINPKITNKGSSDAYVFLVLEVPYEFINTTSDLEIFQGTDSLFKVYDLSSDWVLINETKDESSKKYEVVYAYIKNEGVLSPNEVTPVVFKSLKFASIIEGCFAGDESVYKCGTAFESEINKGFSIKITGVGVQSSNLTLTGDTLKDKLTNIYKNNFGG